MAEEAEGAEVVEVALSAAFGYGADVVGVPETAAAGDGLHAVEAQAGGASGASGSLERVVGGDGVDVADGTDAAVAGEYLVAEVAGVGAETPLVDAVVAAKGAAAFGEDFQVAPAAEGKAVGAFAESAGRGAAAGEGAGDKHRQYEITSGFEVDLDGIDEGHQPGKQLLVDGMVVVGVEGGAVGELHDAAELVSLRARGDVDADVGFGEAGDLSLERANLLHDALLLGFGDVGLPAKGERMDDHAASVYRTA